MNTLQNSPTTPTTQNPIAVTAAAIEAALRAQLNPSRLEVIDESHLHAGHAGANGTGFGTHFRMRIECDAFANLNTVARHRRIYTCLQAFFDSGLHALAIEA